MAAKFVAPAQRGAGRTVCLIRMARCALGGAIFGSFLGVYPGAFFGLLYSVWISDLSPVLDGALAGGIAMASLGAAYGMLVSVMDGGERFETSGESPQAAQVNQQAGALPPGRTSAIQ